MTNIEAALQALKAGIVVKRYDGSYAEYSGAELYLVFEQGLYKLCVRSRGGFLAVEDRGKTWVLAPDGYDESDIEPDTMFVDLYEENFGA